MEGNWKKQRTINRTTASATRKDRKPVMNFIAVKPLVIKIKIAAKLIN
jgi:hypothetical protein